MIILMNSAMMPAQGVYSKTDITAAQAAEIAKGEKLKSYIGYGNCAKILTQLFGEYIPVCRDKTELGAEARIIAVQLPYRTAEKAGWQNGNRLADYRFSFIHYTRT